MSSNNGKNGARCFFGILLIGILCSGMYFCIAEPDNTAVWEDIQLTGKGYEKGQWFVQNVDERFHCTSSAFNDYGTVGLYKCLVSPKSEKSGKRYIHRIEKTDPLYLIQHNW